MLGLLALLGYMAIAAHVTLPKAYGANGAVPALITKEFPDWFAGFAFAAISIGALVPAAIMSIAAANLFTRNIYREYFRPNYSQREESTVAKITSFLIKFGALLFILFIPSTDIINFQLLGGIIIIQTLPAVFLGLYTNWFHRGALIAGWVVGMVSGIWMFAITIPSTLYTFNIGGQKFSVFEALSSVIFNFIVAAVLTLVFRAAGLAEGKDATRPADYEAAPREGKEPVPEVLG
jgi:SSS family solute:Na+ symporter